MVKQISLLSPLENSEEKVWRILILMLGCNGLELVHQPFVNTFSRSLSSHCEREELN